MERADTEFDERKFFDRRREAEFFEELIGLSDDARIMVISDSGAKARRTC